MSEWDRIFEEFGKKFLERRARMEGFDPAKHSFFVHDPETQFISTLLTGYVTNFYYMAGEEVFKYGVTLHKSIIDKEPEFHLDAISIARRYGAMKDQVAIGLLLWSKHPKRKEHFDELVELLATFPPNYLVKKFINAKRKGKHIFGGLGVFEKALIREVINNWNERGLLEYYAAKYRWYMYDIIKLSHAFIPEDIWEYIKKGTRYSGNSEYLKKVAEIVKERKFIHTFNKPKFPFELIRANFDKEEWTSWILENTDLTGNTLILQAMSMYEAIPEVVDYIEKAVKSPTVTADKILKASLVALTKYNDLDHELVQALGKAYAEKVKETYKQLLLPIDKKMKITVVLDASGSMLGGTWGCMYIKAISSVAPFSPLVENLILFSEDADHEDPTLLSTLEGLNQLLDIAYSKYDSGTNIVDGLKLALETESNVVILATDEQANIIRSNSYYNTEVELIKKLINEGKTVIVLNPTPYPVSVTDIKLKDVIYIRAPNPESVIASLKLEQIRRSEKDAKELVSLLKAKIKAKSKKELEEN